MSGGFIVSSWNIGGGVADYENLLHDPKKLQEAAKNAPEQDPTQPPPQLTKDEIDTIDAQRAKIKAELAAKRPDVEKQAYETFKKTAHVFCLQEVKADEFITVQEGGEEKKDKRLIVKELEKANYAICRLESQEHSDTVVAVSRDKFDHIRDRSFQIDEQSDCAIAVATEKSTNRRFAFVSVHVQGYGIRPAVKPGVKPLSPELSGAEGGDNDIAKLITKLEQIANEENCAGVIIGGDFNVIRERDPESYMRLQHLTDKGFVIQDSDKVTSRATVGMAPQHTGPEDRKLDYFAVKFRGKKRDTLKTKSFFGNMIKSLWGGNRNSAKDLTTEANAPEASSQPPAVPPAKDDILIHKYDEKTEITKSNREDTIRTIATHNLEAKNLKELYPKDKVQFFDPGFDINQNPSDHVPIYLRVASEVELSFNDYLQIFNMTTVRPLGQRALKWMGIKPNP